MARTLTVAAAQFEMRPIADLDGYAAQLRSLLDRADGADVVVFPELVTEPLFTLEPGWQDHEVADLGRIAAYTDRYLELFVELAQQRGQVLLAGSHLVAADDGGVRNVAHLCFPDGTVVRHDKTHIFPAEGEWGTGEGDAYEPVEIAGVGVGIAICYEAEIPEVATILSRRGAELLLVPSYTFTRAGFYRVRHTTAARCIENQVYAVHCPIVGDLGTPLSPGRGRASILGPCDAGFADDGVLAEAPDDVEAVISATLDLDLLQENRRTGAATTFIDRQRRAPVYRRFAAELLP